MRICILELDRPPSEHVAVHGDYGDMFENWLVPALPGVEFARARVDLGEPLPQLQTHDSYLLTGCRHGVYDDILWKPALQQFLRQARALKIPLAGVCFGHQIMAATFGAEVRKHDQGWVVGRETYGCNAAFAIHQDQVLTLPETAQASMGTERCAIGRIDYAFPAISVQYHPEFTPHYFETFLQAWRGNPVPEALVDRAMTETQSELHRAEIAREFARVLSSF